MDGIIYVMVGSALVIFLGTVIMFNVESNAPNSEIKTFLDALWWCMSTVTTVGYGDVVPVTSLGRVIAMIYMCFGITMISILLSVITTNFYKRRIENEETRKKNNEEKYLRDLLLNKISHLEEKQFQCNKTLEQMYILLSEIETSTNKKN
jgi:voltage-gated potassium channel